MPIHILARESPGIDKYQVNVLQSWINPQHAMIAPGIYSPSLLAERGLGVRLAFLTYCREPEHILVSEAEVRGNDPALQAVIGDL